VTGDSLAFVGDAAGAGDDVVDTGPGAFDNVVGDSNAAGTASGDNGYDTPNLGVDGGFLVVGDHNNRRLPPSRCCAIGAGDDRITGGSTNDLLIGDNSATGPTTDAGDDLLRGRDGNDGLFGDNADFNASGTFSTGVVGGEDRLDGDAGDDTLRAGPDDDRLDGGLDTDDCDGEAGTDAAVACEIVAGVP
jgi:RTX calcium-binding nonapeptide repeat (4 copies)